MGKWHFGATFIDNEGKKRYWMHLSDEHINGDHSPKFTQQVSLEYQRWLAQRFIIA